MKPWSQAPLVAIMLILPMTAGLIIPTLHSVDRISPGESLIARRLNIEWKNSLDGVVWYSPTIGPKRLQPDFVVLDPTYGLVVLEVKEWKAKSIASCNSEFWKLCVDGRFIAKKNPLQQAREYAEAICSLLEQDQNLVNPPNHRYAGRLCFPYGYGVVFTNLSKIQHSHILDTLTGENIICIKDEHDRVLPWRSCLQYRFGQPLSLRQVNNIRGILFPELVIRKPIQLRQTTKTSGRKDRFYRVMDLKQELLARSLGSGHRVIHGVSGSGKTLVLQCRANYLVNRTKGAVLVLCYNQTLATKLRVAIKRICPPNSNVAVYHFHQWCRQMLVQHKLPFPRSSRNKSEFAEGLFSAVKHGVARGVIPVGQYHSILVDEVHDFAPEWIQFIAQQVSPATKSLLLVYDDAQKLYSHHGSNFSFSSVGVDARGRTNILRTNYRNTKPIIQFAYSFVKPFLRDFDGELIKPQSEGQRGDVPFLFVGSNRMQELFMIRQCHDLLQSGYQLSEIAVLCRTKKMMQFLFTVFKRHGLAYECLANRVVQSGTASSETDLTSDPSLKLVTIHSSKGLEFPIVFIPYIDDFPVRKEQLPGEARLLYVAMTRATEKLFLLKSRCRKSPITDQLLDVCRNSGS